MYTVVQAVDFELRPGGTVKFEGAAYGSPASFFHVKNEPGAGSSLHVHPYPETWFVRSGMVRFTVGGEAIEAGEGDIVVAAAELPHQYVNIGRDQLEMFCIHPSPQIIQKAVDEAASA
jgi:mannose-6-phosphate isomerase-like protein (cupin superfamily)